MENFKGGLNGVPITGRGCFSANFETGLNFGEIPDGFEVFSLNFELPVGEADSSNPPEWIPLLPPGVNVVGHDGRSWINDRPQGIIDWFNNDVGDLPMDWEHATEIKAPKGEPAPAAAWGKELKIGDNGQILGRFEYTPKGLESVKNREYRYISPVLIFEKTTGRVRGIRSVALTNKPNLYLNALNRQQFSKETTMDLIKLLKLLGLPENGTYEDALNAIGKLQGDLTTANNSLTTVKSDLAIALNKANNPPLDKFVPRAEYDAALTRAANAEKAIADGKKEELETAINTEVDAAIKAGKITPASKDYYIAACRQEGGLEKFKEFVKSAPEVFKDMNLDSKKPGEGLSLNAEQQKISDMLGTTAEDIKKYGGM